MADRPRDPALLPARRRRMRRPHRRGEAHARQARDDPRPPLPAQRGLQARRLHRRLAEAVAASPRKSDAEYIVFCGVHFMAEVADILIAASAVVDPARTSPPAARWPTWPTWSRSPLLGRAVDGPRPGREGHAGHLHQLRGRPEGLLRQARRHRLHLDRTRAPCWSGRSRGARRCCSSRTSTWAATPATAWASRSSRWCCGTSPSRWAASRPSRSAARGSSCGRAIARCTRCSSRRTSTSSASAHPDGKVISHPENAFEVCQKSDFVGSTEYHPAARCAPRSPATHWLVGTELNLVNRLADEMKPKGVTVQFMSPMVCMCSTMFRTDPQHLAWVPGQSGRRPRREPDPGAGGRSPRRRARRWS